MPTLADMPVHGEALPPALVEELPGMKFGAASWREGKIVSGCGLLELGVLTTV